MIHSESLIEEKKTLDLFGELVVCLIILLGLVQKSVLFPTAAMSLDDRLMQLLPFLECCYANLSLSFHSFVVIETVFSPCLFLVDHALTKRC